MTKITILDWVPLIIGIIAINMNFLFSPIKTTIGKLFYSILLLQISFFEIYTFFMFSLLFTQISLYILIFICSFTYIRRCALDKKVSSTFYSFCFLVESLSYVIIVTFLFGRFHLEPSHDIEIFLAKENISLLLTFCRNCFDVGLKNFFTLPVVYSINNPHFIQFCFGIIISGSIVTSAIKIISQLIGPKNQEDKPQV